ncbi:MAG TPA: alpha/beta fold hydrolase [Hyphomicrobium sp.]|nr:alpha/beta fold hydrolase [Hyphomicrobium sp.]
MDLKTDRALVPTKTAEKTSTKTGASENTPAFALKTAIQSAPVQARPDTLSPLERDSYTSTALAEVLDRAAHATLAKVTLGLSPASLMGAYFDWLIHLNSAPGKRLQLVEKAFRKALRLQRFAMTCALHSANNGDAMPCIEPLPQDTRFSAPEWQQFPFNIIYQSHLLAQQWWHVATTGVPGVSAQHERALEFAARQILDVFAPSNFVMTNPEVLAATQREMGQNFVRGFQNFMEDWDRAVSGRPPVGAEAFQPGEEVAVTPGKVVYRNRLMELIQYAPTTSEVRKEPVLIVPAWIMKYYILDLSPRNSLVKYLVDNGFTVFVISWKNPDPHDRDLGLDDYRTLGILSALDVISAIAPARQVHGVGYCLGGTLLAIAAAALARTPDSPFASLSFLAAQIDFEEPGELQLFIDESQLRFLEDMMWEQGFLDAKQMSGAFQMLRSNDLVWSRNMREYMLGDRAPMSDLMAWNADSTRLPYRMHSQYLRRLYLNNDLAEGRFDVDGEPVQISDVRVPLFCVSTQKDHVAPWRSVYKWNRLSDTDVTFVLGQGGHNTGIVATPDDPRSSYQIATRADNDLHISPDAWAAEVPRRKGSWWVEWVRWLGERSSGSGAPPPLGCPQKGLPPLTDAPGSYVHMK